MLRRHGGHSLTCVTDQKINIEGVSVIAMPDMVVALPDYLPKLWAWSPEFHRLVGRRFASIDLDVVILDDLAPVLATDAPFRIWNEARLEPYNSSLFVLEPGFGNEVWESYSPDRLAKARANARYWTGDQSWVAHILGPNHETFGEKDGVRRYRPTLHGWEPENCRAVFFCGPYDPATEGCDKPWILKHWG